MLNELGRILVRRPEQVLFRDTAAETLSSFPTVGVRPASVRLVGPRPTAKAGPVQISTSMDYSDTARNAHSQFTANNTIRLKRV